ncbi:MAG: uroporphyrinogen decarboxylase family protein, partial [Dehalococcoidia bacterium]|nr:uroporphyrinogen decarboxylase family protein [Dehalococcoidia bacterium]
MANPRDHDWAAHNAEVASVWQSYLQGRPIRPPVIFDLPAIYTLSHPETNPQGMDFDEYVLDPEKQIQHQLQAQRWTRFWPRRDVPMGPDSGPLRLMVDDQNIYDAAWLGCPVEYRVGQPPYTTPMLAKHPEKLYDLNVPEPTSGFMAGSIERFEYMTEWANGAEFEGFEVAPPTRVKGLATNGVFTVSCIIRGATNLCVDIYENPQYVHDLLDYVTDAVIARVKGLRAYFGEKWPELGHH